MMKRILFFLVVALCLFAIGCSVKNDGLSDPAPENTDDYSSPTIGVLKYVRGGAFQRSYQSEDISHVSSIRMGVSEITRGQYFAVMGYDPSNTTTSPTQDHPAQMMSWYDAVEFCNKLSVLESLTEVYSITNRNPATGYPIASATVSVPDWSVNGYRLPTQMEWLWAAMGGSMDSRDGDSVDGINVGGFEKKYAGSEESSNVDIGLYVWALENSGGTTHPVTFTASDKLPNELGLYNMSGNVNEFCTNYYESILPGGELTDYHGPDNATFICANGLAFSDSQTDFYISWPKGYYPDSGTKQEGFRIVRR